MKRLAPWRRALPIPLLILSLGVHPARAEEPLALGMHRLGLAYDTFLQDPAYDCESLAGCFLYSVCRLRMQAEVHGVPLQQVSLYFQGERLSGVEGFFPSDRFDEVRVRFATSYGQPADGPPSSPEGAAIWQRGSQVLRLERFARPQRASVILAERSFLGELTKTER